MFDPSVRREIAGYLREISEGTELFQQRLSEVIEENNRDVLEESVIVFHASDVIDDHLSRISSLKHDLLKRLSASISFTQTQMFWCQLPYNEPNTNTAHFDHNVFTCQKDKGHIFCRSHNFNSRLCPRCGGTLI
jgi:hypothetical protein